MSNCLKKFMIYYVILLANFFVLFCARGDYIRYYPMLTCLIKLIMSRGV